MNPQDTLNQNIRLLIGDLQVNLMMANARIAELEAQLAAHADGHGEAPIPEVSKPNGKHAATEG
jgi:hypothetical protein